MLWEGVNVTGAQALGGSGHGRGTPDGPAWGGSKVRRQPVSLPAPAPRPAAGSLVRPVPGPQPPRSVALPLAAASLVARSRPPACSHPVPAAVARPARQCASGRVFSTLPRAHHGTGSQPGHHPGPPALVSAQPCHWATATLPVFYEIPGTAGPLQLTTQSGVGEGRGTTPGRRLGSLARHIAAFPHRPC